MRISEEGEVKGEGNSRTDLRYISALNTRRNPDLLVAGGKFLKGNHYFKGEDNKGVSGEESDKEESGPGIEELNKMIHQ